MILLDTQTALWMTTDKKLLSPPAADAIRRASRRGEGIAIASTTLWEFAMMTVKKQFRLPSTLAEYLRYVESMFFVLPINASIAERSVLFSSNFPKDPSDRIISATAIVHGIALVTSDERIRQSGEVNCIW